VLNGDGPEHDVPPEMLLDPELSRLAFNERVLACAEEPATPILERVRMLAIVGQRLDEFFMTRVARLKRQLSKGETRGMDRLTLAAQLDAVVARARNLTDRAYRLLEQHLLPGLETRGIRIDRWATLSERDRTYVRRAYGGRIETAITPLAADAGHPFPHIRNLRPAVAAVVRGAELGAERLVAIELPGGDVPRFLALPGIGHRFVPLEDVIEASLPELYPHFHIVRSHLFRVTRSANIDFRRQSPDILQAIEQEVARRPFQEVVRLECERSMPRDMRHDLLREFQREEEEAAETPGEQDAYTVGRQVDLAALDEIASLDLPHLKFRPLRRREPFGSGHVVEQIRAHDVLLHFPHDSFETTIERFLQESADDPSVLAIKITLYRAAKDSRIVAALRAASACGKEVIAAVELKASFDEQNNIAWARDLEEAGVRVVLSPAHFKVHAKLALVVRRERSALRRFAYVGTGNLNSETSSSYVDLGLLTADPRITGEVDAVFTLLAGQGGTREFDSLLVAPFDMRERFVQLIEREIAHARAGRTAGIRLHLNGLSDWQMIGALYRASQAGVRIDMMVRDTCLLRPGVKAISENISVVSVVGRLLQHARIFHFRNGGADEYFIGSADWRTRNLNERIEVVTLVRRPEHQQLLDTILNETRKDPGAWRLCANGEYVRDADGIPLTVRAAART
jgi:polyphosphate kinase